MASGSYMQVYVTCPYYRTDDGQRKITCEGIIPDTSDTVRFENGEQCRRHLLVFCAARPQNCERYIAIKKTYEVYDDELSDQASTTR